MKSGLPDSTMANEPAATSNALFGPDGTQLPDPLPVFLDPLTGPDLDTWPDNPDPLPVLQVPDASAMQAAIAAAFNAEPADLEGVAAPPHPPDTFHRPRPITQVVQHPSPRDPAGFVPHRPPGSAPPRTFRPVPPTDFRRQVARDRLQTRSKGSPRTGCALALIVFGVLAFIIIAGLVESVSALFR